MKRIVLFLLASALAGGAQTQGPPQAEMRSMTNLVERTQAPSYTDLNCSGYMTKQAPKADEYIVGGEESPNASQFGTGDIVFLNGGGYQQGSQYSIVRQVRDANQMEMFPGQRAAVAAVGQIYSEMGRVRVIGIRGNTAIATVEFSCNAMTTGDFVVPYQEHAQVGFKPKSEFNQWPTGEAGVKARIIMAKDFDTIVATGHKVYLDVGADKGVKPGDYFRIIRKYDPQTLDEVEAFSYKLPQGEEGQAHNVTLTQSRYKDFPTLAVGEMVVLSVSPTSSTAMVTLALRGVNVGDRVELEGSEAAPAAQPGNGQR